MSGGQLVRSGVMYPGCWVSPFKGLCSLSGPAGRLPEGGGRLQVTDRNWVSLFLAVVICNHVRFSFTPQVAEAGAGATGAVEAEEDLEAEEWAGAVEAGAEALWESTWRMKKTFTRRRWK